MESSYVQQSYVQQLFNFDDIHDRPMMNTLVKLQLLGYIQLNWSNGDIRFYDNENTNEQIPLGSSYFRGHLQIHILKENFELYFPSYIPGIVMEKSGIMFSPIEWEWGNHCPCVLSNINERWINYNQGKWKHVCLNCLDNGIWAEVICGSGIEKIKTKVCYIGCQKCVEKQGYTWGRVKLDNEFFKPQCNSFPVFWEGLEDQEQTNTMCIGNILYSIFDYHDSELMGFRPPPQWCDFS